MERRDGKKDAKREETRDNRNKGPGASGHPIETGGERRGPGPQKLERWPARSAGEQRAGRTEVQGRCPPGPEDLGVRSRWRRRDAGQGTRLLLDSAWRDPAPSFLHTHTCLHFPIVGGGINLHLPLPGPRAMGFAKYRLNGTSFPLQRQLGSTFVPLSGSNYSPLN